MRSRIKILFESCCLSPEGMTAIFWFFALALISVFLCASFSWFFWGLWIFVIYSFRDPKRKISGLSSDVYSPADGRIADIEEVELKQENLGKFIRIGIYLSLLSVHVQRVPYAGQVVSTCYHHGKKYPAFSGKASIDNESNTVIVNTLKGDLIVKQIAGFITRGIICNLKKDQWVEAGDRLGVIIFGSRVELYVPSNAILCIKKGNRVKAGETLISRL